MKKGKLNIVGIGPGSDDHITPAVLRAIKEADAVIGYSTYINLVKHHLVGKQVTRTGMAEEITRAQMAVELGKEGNIVTIISSGDAGVYGMAGLVFEVLRNTGWQRGDSPDIQMIPGITADSSCASLVGAPLVHDAVRISLSDLLTPWSVIENRIESAAKGDFVINLYNPASGKRQRQIVEAARIIKEYRPGTTPVALVKSAYRRQQHVELSDLDHFLEFEIGMNTTVIIGSSNTFVYEGFMVTPRGYTNKYQLDDGSLKEGQRRAVSLKSDGDIASKFNGTSAVSGLNITKIKHAFMKPNTSTYTEEDSLNESPAVVSKVILDSSATAAMAALAILQEINGKVREVGTDTFGEASLGYLGRIGGGLLLKIPLSGTTGDQYFMVGKSKEPIHFDEYGFLDPAEFDNQFVELEPKDLQTVEKIKYNILISFATNDPLKETYDKLCIYRNSSVSERILSYVIKESDKVKVDGVEYVDGRWLGMTPVSVWTIVRESLLQC